MSNDPIDRDQRGQATVEFALVVPLVALCASALVAITITCLHLIQLHELARLGARAAATASQPEAAARTVLADRDVSIKVTEDPAHGTVSVTVSGRSTIPMLGTVRRGMGLSATATMIRHSPPVLGR